MHALPGSRSKARVPGWLLAVALLGTPVFAAERPTVTLIIDDLGYGLEQARRTLALAPPIAVAIIPGTPHGRRVAEAASTHGVDVLLHLPMTGSVQNAADPYTIRPGLHPAALERRTARALEAVPHASAVNNHEGSVLTADREEMERFMSVLAEQRPDMIFIDSRTTAESVAAESAIHAGLMTSARDVFLDHDRSASAIEAEVDRWIAAARRDGCALAIGHPYPETLTVLERELRRVDTTVERVDLATYVDRCGANSTPQPE